MRSLEWVFINMTGVLIKKRNLDKETDIEGGRCERTQGEDGYQPDREHLRLPNLEQILPCWHLHLGLLASRAVRRLIFVVLSHSV